MIDNVICEEAFNFINSQYREITKPSPFERLTEGEFGNIINQYILIFKFINSNYTAPE